MAGEAHPVPSRTRKLSPLAPMVLRCSPWESRTPPASKGRFRFARVRAGPRGDLPARAFFVLSGGPRADLPPVSPGACARAARPRRDRASPQNRAVGPFFCRYARSRRPFCLIGLPLICPWAAAPPSIGLNDEQGPSLPVVSRNGERAAEGVDGHADAAHLKLHGLLARIFRLVRSGVLKGGCFLHGWA